MVETRDPVGDLAQRVAVLERALADVQRGVAPDARLQRRVEEQGKGLADLRGRVEEVSAQVSALQGRLETQEKAGSAERESARIGASQLGDKVVELERKIENLQTLAARPPEAPRPPAPPPPDRPPGPPQTEKKQPPQALYDEAYGLYRKQGKHEEAREKFKVFVQTYPDHSLVPNAYFWTGESYYDQGQYEPAILEYENVIKKFPKSDKVPSALLKQGLAFDALNDPVGAKALLKKLVREHPKSDQAAIAQKRLDTLGE